MKKVIAYALVIVCLLGLVPSAYAKNTPEEIAEHLEKLYVSLGLLDISDIKPLVFYDYEYDLFCIVFESEDLAIEARWIQDAKWETLKCLAYNNLEIARTQLSVLGYGNSDIVLVYNTDNLSGGYITHYTIAYIDGAYIVDDPSTGDTEPVYEPVSLFNQ